MVTPGTTGLTRDMDASLETMLDSSILMVIFFYLANEIVIFIVYKPFLYLANKNFHSKGCTKCEGGMDECLNTEAVLEYSRFIFFYQSIII